VWHFGLITPVAPLASLVLMPLVFVILLLGFLGAALAPLAPPLAKGVNRLNAVVAEWSVLAADGAARIPGGCFSAATVVPPPPAMVVFDLEHGGGAVSFRAAGGRPWLLDSGDAAAFERVVCPALRNAGGRPAGMILSHPDSGHLGGAVTALDALRPDAVWLPVERARSPAYRQLQQLVPRDGRRVALLAAGGVIPAGEDAWWEVIHVADARAWDAMADDRCAIMRLHWRGWRILFTSDAGFLTETTLVEKPADVAADVWVTGRHRADPGGSTRFLTAVAPRVIVASHADFPASEQVPPAWRADLEAHGIALFHQGESGAVIIRAEADRLSLEGFLDHRRLELKRK
jgi:beta-lactamase superfamily II metal-dependent hydrolase